MQHDKSLATRAPGGVSLPGPEGRQSGSRQNCSMRAKGA